MAPIQLEINSPKNPIILSKNQKKKKKLKLKMKKDTSQTGKSHEQTIEAASCQTSASMKIQKSLGF